MADQLLIIPEFILHKYVSNALLFLKTDYDAQSDKSLSYLQKLIANSGFQRYDWADQATAVFIKTPDDPRYLEAHLMWNMIKETVPSIHVTLPAENSQAGGNGLGMDEGYADTLYVDSTYDEGNLEVQGSSTPVFTRRYQGNYNVVIVSDNSNEIILIYHVVKSLLTALQQSLALEGLQNIVIGGNDVQIKNDLVPKNMYIRSISISLQYESKVPSLFKNPLFQGILFDGIVLPPIN